MPPTIVLFGYCAETQEQAIADATRYSGEYHQSALTHYEFGGDHLAKLKTYQHYAQPASTKGSRSRRRSCSTSTRSSARPTSASGASSTSRTSTAARS